MTARASLANKAKKFRASELFIVNVPDPFFPAHTKGKSGLVMRDYRIGPVMEFFSLLQLFNNSLSSLNRL